MSSPDESQSLDSAKALDALKAIPDSALSPTDFSAKDKADDYIVRNALKSALAKAIPWVVYGLVFVFLLVALFVVYMVAVYLHSITGNAAELKSFMSGLLNIILGALVVISGQRIWSNNSSG